LEALLALADRGLMVTDVMGLHTANPISGDFSVGASGFLIEGGQISRPVKGVAIAGNLIDVFAQVVEVADDFYFFGNFAAPSFLVESLAVSGS
jgi:PmbA protein